MSEQTLRVAETCDIPENTMSEKTEQPVAHDDTPEVPLGKSTFLYAFFILYCLFALDYAARLGVLSVFPTMQKELGFSDAQLGLIGSTVLMGMSLFVLPISYLADKTSKKHALAGMSALWGVGSALCGMMSGFVPILLGRLLVGMGNASYAPVSVSMLTSWSPKSRWGAVIGTYNSSMAVGMAVGTSLSGVLAVMYGWRVPFVVLGVLTLFFAALALTLPHSTPPRQAAATVTMKEAFGVTLKNRTLVLVGIGGGLANLTLGSLMAWVPMYLVRTFEWSSAEVGGILGPLYLVGGIVVAPLAGIVSDRVARIDNRARLWLGVPVLLISSGLFVAGFGWAVFPVIAAGMLVINLAFAGLHITTQEVVPSRYRASAYGTYVIVMQGLGFFGPVLVGGLSEAFGLTQALMFMQGSLVLAATSLLLAGFTYRVDFARARELESVN